MSRPEVVPQALESVAFQAPTATGGWRRTVAAIACGQFTAKFGFAFATPFLAIFINRELHVVDVHRLAFWTGVVGGSAGIGVAVGSPIWGAIADRFGRKQMLVRAMLAGGVMMALTALVQTPLQLAGGRLLLGGTAGTSSAANALVAAESPRVKVGWSLGVLASATAVGQAMGPLVGGVLSQSIGLRWVVVIGAVLILLPAYPVARFVKETARPRLARRLSIGQVAREAGGPAATAIGVLIVAQCLTQFAFFSVQQMGVVRVVSIDPAQAPLVTGIGFTALGLATGLSAILYTRAAAVLGYRRLAVLAAALLGMSVAATGVASQLVVLVVLMGVIGLVFGALSPSLAAMTGMEAPTVAKATVFGFSASAGAIGQAAGPLASGWLASAHGLTVGLALAGAAALLVALLLGALGREPLAE